MDKRFTILNNRIIDYSLGKFDKRLRVSTKLDEVDACYSSLNMLGDELKAITISRDYFTNIFNAVSDMVFVLNPRGIIEDANQSAAVQLKYDRDNLRGKSINALQKDNPLFFRQIRRELKQRQAVVCSDGVLHSTDGRPIQVRLNASYLKDDRRKEQLVLLTASDITFQNRTENLLIRAVLNTQEKERQRLAKDLHDSLTQQLSAIKFYISSMAGHTKKQEQQKILQKCSDALTECITEMRNICFNLMPKTLEEFGLVKAVREFCDHFSHSKQVNFLIQYNTALPEFLPELAIDLYRVIQEFITNAIRHGLATRISIFFSYRKKVLKLILTDNGQGFDCTKPHEGMGLHHMQSRIKSQNGRFNMTSDAGKGTCLRLAVPINN
ncbi:MAG: hypothetical protein JWP81_1080 [Ferruginibacter sp.]|nr:hypothetical protein [Ferruginibacter sp.]